MKKLALTLGAALGAALIVLGVAPAATAYPEQTCSVSVDRQVVQPKEKFTATGTASGVDAQGKPLPSSAFSWTFEWNGTTKHRTGADVTASFRAPKDGGRTITLTARSTSSAGDCERHVDITVASSSVSAPGNGGHGKAGHDQAAAGAAHGSILPSTGGPAFWILVAGLVLLVGGGGAVTVARRRHG